MFDFVFLFFLYLLMIRPVRKLSCLLKLHVSLNMSHSCTVYVCRVGERGTFASMAGRFLSTVLGNNAAKN